MIGHAFRLAPIPPFVRHGGRPRGHHARRATVLSKRHHYRRSTTTEAYPRGLRRAPALLVLIGGATTLFMSATNTVIQDLAPDEVRGRVLSVWRMIAAGVMPLGSLLLGGLASLTGHVALVIVGGPGVGVVARDQRRAATQPEETVATRSTAP